MSRETLGGQVAKVAEQLGYTLMPWQRHVADVAMEIDPTTGLLYYGEIGLTVPRQSGKTSLILALAVFRALAVTTAWTPGPQTIVYTAQTRNAARKKWEDDHVEALKRSIFKSLLTVRLSNGAEAIKWRNGSRHGIDAATEDAGHGSTVDLAFIDEAFSRVDSRGEQSIKPAMITRAGSQLWVVSTAGKPSSTYLRGKVDRGRARIKAGVQAPVAYFEWSAPEDAPGQPPVDIGSPAIWWGCMPALGHTQSEASIAVEFVGMDEDDFRRAFLNQWRDGKAPSRVIGAVDWELCCDEDSALTDPDTTPIAVAVDATPDSAWAALVVAGIRADKREHVEVINHKPGLAWIVPRCVELRGRRNIVSLTLDPSGPCGSLIPEFEAAGFDVTLLTAREVAAACVSLYTAATEPVDVDMPTSRLLVHRGQASLNAALGGASKRSLGDAWMFSRKTGTDICPLMAASFARRARSLHVESVPYSVLDSFY